MECCSMFSVAVFWMYRRLAAIFLPVALIALVVTAIWGYKENQDKNSILIKTENQYQRAFHDLNAQMVHMDGELGKTLALNSRKQMSNSMTNVWRIAYAAQSDIGQLPMTLMPFDKAQEFMAQIGKFSYDVGVRDLEKEPLSEKEWKTLQTLHQRSEKIRNDLEGLQAKVIDKNLRWMDVEQALASEKENLDNTIIDGFKKVNQTVEQYPEVDWGPTINNLQVQQRTKWNNLKGEKVSKQQVAQQMQQVLGLPSTKGLTVTKNKKGDYATYGVHYQQKKKEINADVTETAGKLVWLMIDRPFGKAKLDYDQAVQKAQAFLAQLGYKNMSVISYDDTAETVSLNFVHQEKGIKIYPEAATVKVAMDNGEIIGLQADEYIFNQVELKDTKPTLTVEQARKQINPHLKVEKDNLAYIYNEAGKLVLCYEFLGTLDKEQYRLFINADTGNEEFIERVEKVGPSV
jgi:spore germination protein